MSFERDHSTLVHVWVFVLVLGCMRLHHRGLDKLGLSVMIWQGVFMGTILLRELVLWLSKIMLLYVLYASNNSVVMRGNWTTTGAAARENIVRTLGVSTRICWIFIRDFLLPMCKNWVHVRTSSNSRLLESCVHRFLFLENTVLKTSFWLIDKLIEPLCNDWSFIMIIITHTHLKITRELACLNDVWRPILLGHEARHARSIWIICTCELSDRLNVRLGAC